MAALSTTQKLTPAADVGTGSGRKVEKQPFEPGKSQPAHRAGGGGSEEPPHALDVARFRRLNSLIHRENVDADELLNLVGRDNRVNLMNDPLLSVVIACKKPELAVSLIGKISNDILKACNYNGDTALHVAAAMDDEKVALELIRRMPDLVHMRNVKQEIPLHKAALYGLKDMFWLLVEKNSSPEARREDGATMLHCAIMGNAPVLALEIAKAYPIQIKSRNEHALTPLQQLVTIPEAFRSQVVLGALDSFIYKWIPLEEDSSKMNKRDEEVALNRSSIGVAQDDDGDHSPRAFRSKFSSNYSTLFDLLELTSIPAGWIQRFVYNIIRQLSSRVQRLSGKKKNHAETMHLIEYLAKKGYFEFFVLGNDPTEVSIPGPQDSPPETGQEGDARKRDKEPTITSEALDGQFGKFGPPETVQEGDAQKKALSPSSEDRWNEPPLILGAQMGLHDFVGKILEVCPQSATYLDTKGRNVLQVAVMYRRKKIVKIIKDMRTILPSWLFSKIDPKTGNTILHLASRRSPDVAKKKQDEPDAMQLHYDLVWFEMVQSIIPKELVHSRNKKGKTARELFTSSHKQMRKTCKNRLVGFAKICTSAVAAVVFAMSSSISHTDDPKTRDSPLFKDSSQMYVIGLSFGATSLILLLSLVHSSYNEQEFRRFIPFKFILASFTYSIAMAYLLMAFTINTYLQIHGEGAKEKQLNKFMLEIIAGPLISFFLFPDAIFRTFRHFIELKCL